MIERRKNERFEYHTKVRWDFFAQEAGKKDGFLTNISQTGCLLLTDELIENRRWLRLSMEENTAQVHILCIGRIVRFQSYSEYTSQGTEIALFSYGIEFTHPNYWSLAATDLILALSRRNLIVRSCLNLNSKSSFRPGFLA